MTAEPSFNSRQDQFAEALCYCQKEVGFEVSQQMAQQSKLSQAVILSAEHLLVMLTGAGFLPRDLDFLQLGNQDCIMCSSLLLPQKQYDVQTFRFLIYWLSTGLLCKVVQPPTSRPFTHSYGVCRIPQDTQIYGYTRLAYIWYLTVQGKQEPTACVGNA